LTRSSVTRPASGNEDTRGTGVEGEIAFNPFAPRVLAPEGDGDEEEAVRRRRR